MSATEAASQVDRTAHMTCCPASLGYSDCLLFRPGFLAGAQREKTRIMESVAGVSPWWPSSRGVVQGTLTSAAPLLLAGSHLQARLTLL